jgi:MoaA/NifB/PqqE/SkfB family radical SAM enzyme
LTSGVLLERCAEEVARHIDRVIVSLDATSDTLYQAIRGVPALAMVEKGVAALRRRAPALPVTARATLHRMNFRELVGLIDHARAMALDGISFLPADVTSSAFNRTHGVQASALTLSASEVAEFTHVVDEAIASRPDAFRSGFVAESPERLRRLPQYYAALNGDAAFPGVACNAPWMSVVVEADGAVRPCFFHEAIGNIRKATLGCIVGGALPAFRKQLDVGVNPICQRCVCSIRTGWRATPWQ